MPNPYPKPTPREKSRPSRLQSKKRLKNKPDPIPNHVKDEVDKRDNCICQKCGRYLPPRMSGKYHHILNRAKRYEPMVRFWHNGDWMMVPVWFEFHSVENIVTLCPLACHTEAEGVDKHQWEQWRDKRCRE
jgi:hypothetical protein